MKVFMGVLMASAGLMVDGDAAFLRVNNRDPVHALEPGTVERAVNCRFDQGKPRPRFGVAVDDWGIPGDNLCDGLTWSVGITELGDPGASVYVAVTGLEIGAEYQIHFQAATVMSTAVISAGGTYPSGTQFYTAGNLIPYVSGTEVPARYRFTATTTEVYLFALDENTTRAVNTTIRKLGAASCAYKRFSDPLTDTDQWILITDEWRTEDDGRGRAWRIIPGNGPQEIPLNGHDVWGTSRLIQCDNAMVLLRHGDERHYFNGDALTALTDKITLNCAPSWPVGEYRRVRFEQASDGAQFVGLIQNITDTDLAANTITVASHGLTNGDAKYVSALSGAPAGMYFVRSVTASTLTLHPTYADAIAGTNTVNLTADNETGTLEDKIPAPGNYYWARHFSSNAIKLYQDRADAAADTDWLAFSPGALTTHRFYILLATDPAPFFGNGAPPLIMQPDGEGATAFDNGFKAVDRDVAINDTDNSLDIITARNHRLTHGDSVTGTAITGVTWPAYAAPQSLHTLRLYTTEDYALADDGTTGLVALTNNDETGTIWKTSASQLAMPPMREGIHYKGRLVGINGFANIVVSDANDYLHFEQFKGTIPVDSGRSGRATWLLPLGEDALLVGKENAILIITGLSGDSSGWRMDTLTEEFGGIAGLAALNVGADGWMLSRKGVASIVRTVAGEKLGVTRTVSDTIPEDFADVDWIHANAACAEVWNNRFFLAVPTKGQTDPVNNKVLVFNFINQSLAVQQTELAGDIVGKVAETGTVRDAWEGTWEGDWLIPYAFDRLVVNGEERLTYATPDGLVCWLHDGWTDLGEAVETEFTTRGYFGGRPMLTLRGAVNWDSFNSLPTVQAKTAGYNEVETVAGMEEVAYDRTAYLIANQTAYDPSTSTEEQFDAPHRSDYSPSPEELLVAKLDIHQNITEPLRLRLRDRSPQLVISNARGSLRVNSASLQGKPVGVRATRST